MHKHDAWERFQTGGEPMGLDQDILASWRRSKLSGVNPLSVDYRRIDIDVESRFARIAIPLMNDMAELLTGTETSMAIANGSANLLWRWAPDSRLRSALDDAGQVVGHSFNEEFIGTNAVGTSLEVGRTVTIKAEHHFRECFHQLNCVATPVIDPITRRALGTINLTWPPGHTEATFAAIVQKMAREVQGALKEAASVRERRLLQEFLEAEAKSTYPVVALNSELIIGNHFAADPHFRRDVLWGRVLDGVGRRKNAEIESPDGSTATVRAIFDGRSLVGAVLIFDNAATTSESPVVTSGSFTPARPDAAATADHIVRRGGRVVLRGEPGTGKRTTLAKAFGTDEVSILDASNLVPHNCDEWFAALRRALGSTTPLILTHLNDLDPKSARGVASAITAATNPPKIAATVVVDPDQSANAPAPVIDALGATVLDVTPLRNRHDEIEPLAQLFAGEIEVRPEAVTELQKYPWPGNITELRQAIGTAAARATGKVIQVEDLPGHIRASVWGQRRLTLLERAEADVILRVLARCNGNKTIAAKQLGVSRPTLYAKIRAYKIPSEPAVRASST
ncbi:sigma-54-dependent Fis family transcriptional regulator [Rhodococcus opacus]|uniref:sigma-54-dependent Fis family transcriptional regulator n=1 Tax=Rhodococcus opacus TaxID=37919 RepID=UPI00155B193B|nr:helix-turn-helix domain-containing protein [Rhodococcus opacus]